MTRMFMGIVLAIAVAPMTPAIVCAQSVEGSWRLSYVTSGAIENTAAIVKLKTQDGKTTGEMLAANPRYKNVNFKSATQTGATLTIAMKVGATELVFETTVPKQAGKRLNGVMSIEGTRFPAMLSATEDMTLDAKGTLRLLDCPPMQKARSLTVKASSLRTQAAFSKDPEKKKELLKQAAEADAIAKKETPALYREVLAKHADSPAALEAALILIRGAKTSGAKAEEIRDWAAAGVAAARTFGPSYEGDYATQVATALLTQEGMDKLALDLVRQAEKSLSPTTSANEQVKVLSLLVRVLKKVGQNDDINALTAKIDKLETILDAEYSAKMPSFKGTAFKGRTSKSERAAFMELFTGAACPPCVAADLAFDVLQKTYKPSELVLIQYHMHIPGPDPLTNPDTEARWSYYAKAFAGKPRGVPSSIFNGKPAAAGGGGFADAEKKYDAYREVIDPLLEENAGAKIVAQARRKGDKIDIFVKVSELNEPGADKKLRILLAEETVRYAGSNRIRLHHNVVRAFPGGVAGVALKEAASRHQASIDLGELRTGLTKYLDNYEATFRPFANPARPMAFNNLRVIAFVQDDSTFEILQAAQVEVEMK